MPAKRKWVPYHVWLARRGKRKYTSSRRNIRGRGAYYGNTPQNIYGTGNYFTKGFRKAANFVKSEAKALAPGIFKAGAQKAGQALISGFGDYHIHTNSLIRGKAPAYTPTFGNGAIRIRHREYLGSVNASTVFSIGKYDINPGLVASFPWLAQIAQNFEQYRFHGLVYHYKSTTSDAISGSTDLGFGQVMMATDYDSTDADYGSTVEMLNSMFANSTKPSCDLLHAVECAPDSQPYKLYFVRSGTLPANADIKTYDLGKFQFGTEGMATPYVGMGQLWCTYDISFYKPQAFAVTGTALLSSHYLTGTEGNSWEDNPFGLSSTPSTGNSLPLVFSADGRTMEFPNFTKGSTFLMAFSWNGDTPAIVTVPTIKGNNLVFKRCWESSATLLFIVNGGTVTTFIMVCVVRVLSNEGPVYMAMETDGVFPTGANTEGTITVSMVDGDTYAEYPETLIPN